MEELNISEVRELTAELGSLEDKLLVLRLDLGKLRAALERAFAPIAATVVPLLDAAVRAITGFVNAAGQVIAALFGRVEQEAKTTTKTVSGSLKRALADFDTLDRLSFGGSGSTVTVTVPSELKEIPQQYQAIADRIRAILKPFQEIDLSAAVEAFGRLREAVAPLTQTLFAGLRWAWDNILVPMAGWAVEQALPVFLDTLTALLGTLNAVITAAKPMLSWLWENWLRPMGQWVGEKLLSGLQSLSGHLNTLSGWLTGLAPSVEGFTGKLSSLGLTFEGVLTRLRNWAGGSQGIGGFTLLTDMAERLRGALELVGTAVQRVKSRLSTLATQLAPTFKTLVNSAIGLLNTALNAIESAINSMVTTLNGLSLQVPAWVPGLGGRKLSFHLASVDLPSIPYLAKGAVLPANQPFLAMVGDQRHGTNIEAPLSVIEEAVAGAMGANLAGQDTANALLQQILRAIEGITVGDEVIGRAARRYEQRQARMTGSL